jgi:hypothetical protein
LPFPPAFALGLVLPKPLDEVLGLGDGLADWAAT